MLCCINAAAGSESPDSTKNTTTLSELVVEGDREFTNQNTTTYVVSKTQRRHSFDGVQLLRAIGIPQLRVNTYDNTVSTLGGEEVAFFINGLPANQNDVNNLLCKDALKVEYISDSTDPRYLGHKNVVNFVMREYEYGGYTRINAKVNGYKTWDFTGDVYSKFNYKKMTFDVSASSLYFDTKRSGEQYSQKFKLHDADGKDYIAERNLDFEYGDNHWRKNATPVSFRATYNTDKMVIRNSVGFSFSDDFIYSQHGKISIIPKYKNPGFYDIASPGVNRAYFWSGYYYFMLPKSFTLSLTPTVKYAHNNSYYKYSTTLSEANDINTYTKENTIDGSLGISLRKQINSRHNLNLNYYGDITRYITDYRGTTNYNSRLTSFSEDVKLGYDYNYNRLSLAASAELRHDYQKTTNNSKNYFVPDFEIRANYSPNNKNQIMGILSYGMRVPRIVNSSDFLMKIDEYLYSQGSDNLKTMHLFSFGGRWSYFPTHFFGMGITPNYSVFTDVEKMVYLPSESGSAIIRRRISNGDWHNIFLNTSFSFRLLNDNLSVNLFPNYSMYKVTGENAFTKHNFLFILQASYFLKAFNFSLRYDTPSKSYNPDGSCLKHPNIYKLSVGWNTSNSLVMLTFTNPFASTRYYSKNIVSSPYYSYDSIQINDTLNNAIELKFVYAFDYGKKVKIGNEVRAGVSVGSTKEGYNH